MMKMKVKKIHYSTSEKGMIYNVENSNWNILCNPNMRSQYIHGTRKKRLVNCGRCLIKIKKLEAKKDD